MSRTLFLLLSAIWVSVVLYERALTRSLHRQSFHFTPEDTGPLHTRGFCWETLADVHKGILTDIQIKVNHPVMSEWMKDILILITLN